LDTASTNTAVRSKIERLELEKSLLEHQLKTTQIQLTSTQQELRSAHLEIEALKRQLFGSRSEHISHSEFIQVAQEMTKETTDQEETPTEVIGYTRRIPKPKDATATLPDNLETITQEIIPPEVQAEPEAYERIGEEVTEELDIQPMRVIKRRIVRPKYKRKAQVDAVPFTAELPARVIPGGIPAAGLIAFIIVAKYVDHLPLYRIEKAFTQRFGIKIPRQRMCDWIGYVTENLLSLIYYLIRQDLLKGGYLQIDETPIRYLDPDHRGQSHRGYLWAYGRPGGDICFDWSQGRGKPAAETILKDYNGLLQSDGYTVYDSVCNGKKITQLGCWAHARRKFYEAYKQGEKGAAYYLLKIRELYAIEAEIPEGAKPAEVAALRQEKSTPILTRIRESLEQDQNKHLPKIKMSQAIGYAKSQWEKLITYVQHGQTRIDNNLTEQAIRPTKLGMKNWLFIGHPEAGDRAAIIYTILECCRRHGVEPLAYLNDVLRRLPGMTNHEAAKAGLTPKEWAKQHKS
jgi:transposase